MRIILLVLAICLLPVSALPVFASVVMTGTRVIYPEAASGKTLQLSNDDDHPWLVQMWLDDGAEKAAEEATEDASGHAPPFVVSPPIFRVEPHSGHVARLRFVGDEALPSDRESLFYLNFSQIPAQAADADQDANRLLLVHKTRLKLFYRPRALKSPDVRALACALRFSVEGDEMVVENPKPFHAVVSQAELQRSGTELPLLQGQTLAPFSTRRWPLPQGVNAFDAGRVQISLINDYGADERHLCPLR